MTLCWMMMLQTLSHCLTVNLRTGLFHGSLNSQPPLVNSLLLHVMFLQLLTWKRLSTDLTGLHSVTYLLTLIVLLT